MDREAIAKEALKMTTILDFTSLLNRIKISELGDRGYPFTLPQVYYFINSKRSTAHYREFTIPKKSGGVRTISAPVRLLRSMQTYTNRILQSLYEAPNCVTGFVPSKSVADNARIHVGMNYVFNTDLKDFFSSIPQARVWGALRTRPFCFNETLASAIAGLCCIEELRIENEEEADGDLPEAKLVHVLPQGSPCSPILTNIVCHNLDWKLSGLARRFHLRYSRYADDITFSSNHNVYQEDGEFMTEFRRIIAEQNFTLNEKKTRLQKKGERQEVTGLVVSNRVNVTREYVRDLDNLLYIWERYGRHAAFTKFLARYVPKQNFPRKNPEMISTIQGRLSYIRMVKGAEDPTLKKLQKRFERLLARPENSLGTKIIYLDTYSIEDFERIMGCKLEFIEKFLSDCPGEEEYGFLSPHFTLNGHQINVQLSKYARTRIKNILEKGTEEDLVEFKKRFKIAYCRKAIDEAQCPIIPDDDPEYAARILKVYRARMEKLRFWMIVRGMKKKPQAK